MARLFAKLPDGKLVSRSTHHKYTHVLAVKGDSGAWYALRWTAVPGKLKSTIARYRESRLVAVEQQRGSR